MGMTDLNHDIDKSSDEPKHADRGVFSLNLDRSSAIPAYQQLKFHIIHALSTRRLRAGDVMPSVREASQLLGLAPATVQRTYGELRQEGFLDSKPGHYVFVTGLDSRRADRADQNRYSSLRDVLVPVYVNARSMGFTDSEIMSTLEDLTAHEEVDRSKPRLAFVGLGRSVVDKYVPILADALSVLGAEVVGVELDEFIASDGAVLEEIGPVHLAVSLVSWLSEVREIGARRGIHTVGLLVEPSPETKRVLVSYPYGTKIGLITEPRYVTNVAAIIEQLCGPQVQVVTVVEDSAVSKKTLASCDVYVRTFRAEELARSLLPPGVEATEFRVLPVQASLEHTEALLLQHWLEAE